MQNPVDLTQAIKALERETQKEAGELHAKEGELLKKEDENRQLKQEIINMQRDIDLKKKQISDNDHIIPKLKTEIDHTKREQLLRHSELEKVKRDYTSALNQSGMKLSNSR